MSRSQKLPRDIQCPRCNAAVNHGCRSTLNAFMSARTHVARWKAIGVERPTDAHKLADMHDAIERDYVIRREVFARLWHESTGRKL